MNQLTNAQKEELLRLLQEECAEVIQIVSKILRFGPDSFHPEDESKTKNFELLVQELGDVFTLVDMLKCIDELHIDDSAIELAKARKHAKLSKWLKTF